MAKGPNPSSYSALASQYATLRVIVGFLGEKSQKGWWDTDFLNPTGLQFLAINFPRSYLSAGCTSVTVAARRVHDELIGKSRVYHLFRFAQPDEEAIHQSLPHLDPTQILEGIRTPESALKHLRTYFSEPVSAPVGPVQVGGIRQARGDFGIQEVAKHYYDAFLTDKRAYPYFRD